MPDITMCTGGLCPQKTKCYRYLAEPDEQQSFSDFVNVISEDGTCTSYYPMSVTVKVPVEATPEDKQTYLKLVKENNDEYH